MKTVNVHEAKTSLSALLVEVEHGAEIVIARNGTPVAKLSAYVGSTAREPGVWRQDPAWANLEIDLRSVFAPLSEHEAREEGWP